jgi:hypothetical protein
MTLTVPADTKPTALNVSDMPRRHMLIAAATVLVRSGTATVVGGNAYGVCVRGACHGFGGSYGPTLHHMTRPGSILRGVQIYFVLARVRIWVISTVIAPNKHISCKSCSSRTRPSVTATMIVIRCRFRRQPVGAVSVHCPGSLCHAKHILRVP